MTETQLKVPRLEGTLASKCHKSIRMIDNDYNFLTEVVNILAVVLEV